jgi:hypothetical protein
MISERERLTDAQMSKEGLGLMHRIRKIDARITVSLLKKRGILPTTMGRSIDEDPEFFMAAGAAGIYAAELLSGGR